MAAEQATGMYGSIALVDISYVFKKNWHGAGRDAAPGEAAQRTLDELAGVRESVDHCIVCCDAPPYRRKEVYAEYKAQRERPPEEELAQKRWLLDRIEKDGYSIARAKGYEADDVIATLCADLQWCSDVRIVGSDKDVAQCVGECVRMFVPAVGNRPAEIRGPEEIRKKYGVAPSDMPLWLALCGDKSDNIPGVPSIGPKKATQLITDCKSLNGIAEALATASGEGAELSSMWRALADNWENLRLSLQLTKLELDAPVDVAELLKKREPVRLVKEEEVEEPTEAEFEDAMFSRSKPGTAASVDPKAAAKDAVQKFLDDPYKAPELKARVAKEHGIPWPPPGDNPKSDPPPAPIVKTNPNRGLVTEDLQPTDIDAAWRLAKAFYESRMYAKYPNPESIFTVMVKGRELGMKVTVALDCFSVIKGVPRPSADLIQALCERDPDCEYFKMIESTAERAVYRIKRRSHDKAFPDFVYTMEDAKTAGLASNDNYRKNPAAMLRARCKSTAGRVAFPGATCGLYCPEEMDAA